MMANFFLDAYMSIPPTVGEYTTKERSTQNVVVLRSKEELHIS